MKEYKGLIDRMDTLKDRRTKLMMKKELLEKSVQESKAELVALGVTVHDGDLAAMKEQLIAECETIKAELDNIETRLDKMCE